MYSQSNVMKVLKFALKIILILSLFESYFFQQCSVEYNIDYQGINNPINPTTFTLTPDLCCYSCYMNSSCQVWSYVASTKACYLKSSIGQKVAVKDISMIFFISISFGILKSYLKFNKRSYGS